MALTLASAGGSLTLLHTAPATRVEHVTATRLPLVRSGTATLHRQTTGLLTLCSCNVDAMTAGEVLTPVFSNVALTAGETTVECNCDTDRAAVVRYRAQLVTGGTYVTTPWEPTAKTLSHRLTISGLIASKQYRIEIEIDATVDPDLGWSAFADGITGPVVSTSYPDIGG